jgi:phage-related protein
MNIITDQPSTMEGTQFADLKKSKKSMRAFEGKQQDNTGVYMRELTDQEALKSWKALTHVLENLCAFTTQKTKGLQLKI